MLLKHLQSEILQKLSQHNPGVGAGLKFYSVGGGSINETYRMALDGRQFLCKINSASQHPGLFEKEKYGLTLIESFRNIRTPEVIDCFETGDYQVLILGWINSGDKNPVFWKKFGEQLAALHANTSGYFGLDEDNYMGSVRQLNGRYANWNSFFVEKRLQPLVEQCALKQLLLPEHIERFDRLYSILPQIFDDGQKPSLQHGDLWSGNYMCDENGAPVLIDPAVYYGHPSVDLGMTTLFGGFDQDFFDAYNYHSPFPKNYRQQWQVCNLYPLLIHLLLFGRSYLAQIEYTLTTIS